MPDDETPDGEPPYGGGFSYSTFDGLTRRFVDERGLVDYRGLKSAIGELRAFVDELAAASPESRPDLFATDDDRKRYYLTAYNAIVLHRATEAFPDRHAIWSRLGWFKNHEAVLGGRLVSLEEIEHKILRKQFRDPRIHFYINCAAMSCPRLARGAIPDGATDRELDRAARRFVDDPAFVYYEPSTSTLHLSKIFDWFAVDFLDWLAASGAPAPHHVKDYVARYLEGDAGRSLAKKPPERVTVRFLAYDKSLNETRARR